MEGRGPLRSVGHVASWTCGLLQQSLFVVPKSSQDAREGAGAWLPGFWSAVMGFGPGFGPFPGRDRGFRGWGWSPELAVWAQRVSFPHAPRRGAPDGGVVWRWRPWAGGSCYPCSPLGGGVLGPSAAAWGQVHGYGIKSLS